MKAARINDYGHVDKIEIQEIGKPSPAAGQVLVEVHASGLNPVDSALREGYMRQMADIPMPATIGSDIAGVVESVGADVTEFKPGDKVYGTALGLFGASGALAEFAVTPVNRVAAIPSNTDFVQSASLPLVGASAVQALIDTIKLQSGQKLFINGGAGGIGTVAIQIAKNIGAYVAVSSKGDHTELLKGLGTDEVIDVETQDYSESVNDYDAVLNLARTDEWEKLFSTLKSGGVFVSLTGLPDESVAKDHNVTAVAQMTDTSAEKLDVLRGLVEEGVVKPQVAQTFPLDQIREAFDKLEQGGVSGKIVIKIKD
jgi:NADPH:quinone reductase-like Zn-dependent oxidoreductase